MTRNNYINTSRTCFAYLKAVLLFGGCIVMFSCSTRKESKNLIRQRISINNDWKFFKYENESQTDQLIYDVRPKTVGTSELRVADSKPTEAEAIQNQQEVLKPWILPSGNEFIKNPSKRYIRPEGFPGRDFPFVQTDFDDSQWKTVNLPHDWAIAGPFQTGENPEVGGGMGRLPVNGVAWYRKKIEIPASDSAKSIFLDVNGAMSYAMVWLNGKLVGGWPYGYNSWRLNLSPFIHPGGDNHLAIRLDNPNQSARWYPGGGIYRNVWLTITDPVHVAHWGTFISTSNVSKSSANIHIEINIDNNSAANATVKVQTKIFSLDSEGKPAGKAVAVLKNSITTIPANGCRSFTDSVVIKNPKLWGPPPSQKPNLYLAVTEIVQDGKTVDWYKTRFGIRSLEFNPDKGLLVNGEHIFMKGVNQHHDLGSLGAAFNTRAAERQLEILREMGCNAIRMAHNPPAPELLELTDKMGFLVIDEIFDSWEMKKTPLDFHLIFPDWFEQDARAMVRRDKNCPSVIMWSYGNEVGEQYTEEAGATISAEIKNIIQDEDPTRLATVSMNFAKPDMPFSEIPDIISLNYQGEGIRQEPIFDGTDRIRTAPQYDAFHKKFPDKMIQSSETASAFSSRGIYLFPVTPKNSSPVRDTSGGNSEICQVSSYDLYAVDFGASPDKVFASIDQHPFVSGDFVWTGWDYIGEPTPYYSARSSYTGIIDLAGFKKDRFYLYQAHWRPDFPMVHILPHWNWPKRMEKITPVHVYTSGDEVELFLNGISLGKKKKAKYEYRLRWDDVKYEPGELRVVAYKDRKVWAEETIKTTGKVAALRMTADRDAINADGKDLSFITLEITDENGLTVAQASAEITFSTEGPGEIVATDNGDPTDMTAFPSKARKAFSGKALVIVRSKAGEPGIISVNATSVGLKKATIKITAK
ncbi:MAG: beta-galactosidase GalB [Draconibacterium sp.]